MVLITLLGWLLEAWADRMRAYFTDSGTTQQSTERGQTVNEKECKAVLICATGESQHLTFLREGPQDTSFIEGIRNAL